MSMVPFPAALASLEQALISLRIANMNVTTWLEVGKHLKEDALERLLDIIKDSDVAAFLNENIEAKRTAFESGDDAAWQRILEDEQRFLNTRTTGG
jgi:hypothetical protein